MRFIVSVALLLSTVSSFAYASPIRCELRKFCHDRGMPAAEDETSHFVSVFLTATDAGVIQMSQADTDDSGATSPAVVWSPACENFKSQIEAFFRIDAKTECVEVNLDGSYTPTWN